jgi:hypothetical protein
VLPVSDRLGALVSGPEYEEAVAREAAPLAYRLVPRETTALAHGRERRS